jgi:hypothetical protein
MCDWQSSNHHHVSHIVDTYAQQLYIIGIHTDNTLVSYTGKKQAAAEPLWALRHHVAHMHVLFEVGRNQFFCTVFSAHACASTLAHTHVLCAKQ